MPLNEQSFLTLEEAALVLAARLEEDLAEALEKRGEALLAVSGGRTPRMVFERLSRAQLDWGNVTVTLSDERWVAPDHPDSNEKLVRDFLLKGPAAAARFVPLYGGEETPEAGQAGCEARLEKLKLPFDAVYLGMGGDGHFASLFPGDPAVMVTEGRCVAAPATEMRVGRMSLTAPAILEARQIYLLFSGEDKHRKYAEAQRPGDAREVPLRLVMQQSHSPVCVLMAN